MPGETDSTYNLLLHENQLVNPLGQDPSTARRLVNFIPTKAGELKRKEYSPPFSDNPPDGYWFSFVRDYIFYTDGAPVRRVIVGVSNNSGTFLYERASGGALTPLPAGAYSPPHNPAGGWVGDPLLLYSDGLLYISDGSNAGSTLGTGTVYDGADTWSWGLDVPDVPVLAQLEIADGVEGPSFTGTGLNDLSVSGNFTGIGPDADAAQFTVEIISIGPPEKFRWRRDLVVGAASVLGEWSQWIEITGGAQYLRNGISITFAATTGHTLNDFWVIDCSGIYIEKYVEYVLTEYDVDRVRESAPGPRLRVTPQSAGYWIIHLTLPARVNTAPGTAADWTVGYPPLFRIYRSLLDGTTQLFRLDEVPAYDYIQPDVQTDTSPFYGDDDYSMLPFEPPFRNQKPKPSLVGVKAHNRFFLRDEDRKSRLWVTGFQEILEQGSFSPPLETVPGTTNQGLMESTDEGLIRNASDYENFVELTNEAFEIRGMLSFRGGVMLGTEKDVVMLFGTRPEEPFRVDNVATYKFGIFHKNGFLLTTHGLVMFTADRRLVLDPAAGAGGGDRTAQVEDIGWPKQNDLDKTDIQYSNRFEMVHYQFGKDRDWLIVAYTTQDAFVGYGQAHLLVYDFQVRGWISFDDVLATCVGIVQENQGFQFLLAGGSVDGGTGAAGEDRKLRVVTGYDSSATSAYAAAAGRIGMPAAGTETRPANTYQTPLMDFGSPNRWHVWNNIQFYKKPATPTVVVKYWADPADVDALGAADQTFTFTELTSRAFEAWVKTKGQAKRAVFEFTIAAGGANGSLYGLELNAIPGTEHSRL